MTINPQTFRFDAGEHEYVSIDTGEVYPHITGMLQACGLVNDKWYTPASCERGSCVHRLTTDYDLGAIAREDVPAINSIYKGWLAAHIKAMDLIQPEWLHIEEPFVSTQYRFGGRPDRVGRVYGALAVVDIKSGAPEPAHRVQLALQSILVAPILGLPAETLPRYALYLKRTGKFHLEHFPDQRTDLSEAFRCIRKCCGR